MTDDDAFKKRIQDVSKYARELYSILEKETDAFKDRLESEKVSPAIFLDAIYSCHLNVIKRLVKFFADLGGEPPTEALKRMFTHVLEGLGNEEKLENGTKKDKKDLH